MTVIVALHDRGETWIGADSRCTMGQDVVPGVMRKIAYASGVQAALLVSGSGGIAGRIVRAEHELVHEQPERTMNQLEAFMLELESRGLLIGKPAGDEGLKRWDVSFIYANKHGVWDVDLVLNCIPISRGVLWARGSGGDLAQGAGHALRLETPRRRVEQALEAAIAFNNCCAGPAEIRRL